MKEAIGNLWDFEGIHVITTNGFVRNDGRCVMGRGCALEAVKRWPEIDRQLGDLIRENGNHVFYVWPPGLLTFPVKHNWWERADIDLIRQSCHELIKVVNGLSLVGSVYLPRPGCGNGSRRWSEVKPVIEPILNDRFTVVTWERV